MAEGTNSTVDVTEENNNLLEDRTQLEGSNMGIENSRNKRDRELDSEEVWNEVQRNSKRKNRVDMPQEQDILISVTSKEKMPKQFTFAKLMKDSNISDIIRVKYINPYKILVTFSDQSSAEKILRIQGVSRDGLEMPKNLGSWPVVWCYQRY